jgi:hypothetical protein
MVRHGYFIVFEGRVYETDSKFCIFQLQCWGVAFQRARLIVCGRWLRKNGNKKALGEVADVDQQREVT